MADPKQLVFEEFEVPDPIRIKKATRFIRDYFREIKGLNILECGIAKGGVADLLSREGVNAYGIDINPRRIPGVIVSQADLNSGFPEFKTRFDVIFAGEVMEHLFNDEKFVEDCRKLLKPGGLLIITVPNLVFSANRFLMLFGKMPKFAYAPFHYHIYNRKTLTNLIEGGGFSVVKLISSHVLFSTRRNKLGKIFEILGDFFPSLGAHLIIFARSI